MSWQILVLKQGLSLHKVRQLLQNHPPCIHPLHDHHTFCQIDVAQHTLYQPMTPRYMCMQFSKYGIPFMVVLIFSTADITVTVCWWCFSLLWYILKFQQLFSNYRSEFSKLKTCQIYREPIVHLSWGFCSVNQSINHVILKWIIIALI